MKRQIIIELEIDPCGETDSEIEHYLMREVKHLIDEGVLTQNLESTIENWSAHVCNEEGDISLGTC